VTLRAYWRNAFHSPRYPGSANPSAVVELAHRRQRLAVVDRRPGRGRQFEQRRVELTPRRGGGEDPVSGKWQADLAARGRAQPRAVDGLPVGDGLRIEAERVELAQGERGQPVAAALVARERGLVDDDHGASGASEERRRRRAGRAAADDQDLGDDVRRGHDVPRGDDVRRGHDGGPGGGGTRRGYEPARPTGPGRRAWRRWPVSHVA
jgi:hypothetical protein